MAGTRRRSRLGDTNTHHNQHSVPHITAVDEGCADDKSPQAADTAESVDQASPHDLPISRSTKGFCRSCKNNIGDFYNSWHKVTGSYFVPALLGSYQSLLNRAGKQKAASKGTDLEGCTIQPLSCPSPGCADSPIGFTVVHAPTGKRNFRGRDFFKLNRIELRCEIPPNQTIVVEPNTDKAPQLLTVEDSASPTPDPIEPKESLTTPPPEAMEVDSCPTGPQHPGLHLNRLEQNHQHALQHQPLQQVDPNRDTQPLPPSMQSHSGLAPLHSIPPKTPSNTFLSTSKLVHEEQFAVQKPSRDTTVGYKSATRELPSITSQSQSSLELHRANGLQYPRSSQDVGLDAIERLQTQISQNSGALAAHTRDIRRGEESFQQLEDSLRRDFQGQLMRHNDDIQRVDDAVARLQHEIQGIHQILEGFSRELHTTRVEKQPRGLTVPPVQTISVQDSALELMAQQIAVISQKSNEVDTLKITIEIMKNKIQRLEDGTMPTSSQATPLVYRSPKDSTLPSSQSAQTIIPYHSTPAPASQISTITQTLAKSQSYQPYETPSSAGTPEMLHKSESVATQRSGWATVNSGLKRTYTNTDESPHQAFSHLTESPKRQRLATVEPHATNTTSQNQAPKHYRHIDPENLEARPQVYPHTLPSQHSITESILASQVQQSDYIPYGTHDGLSDDSWQLKSQRNIEHRRRGRGRGGGPGSRGGRGRKSMPTQLHAFGLSEKERHDWQDISDSQTSPDGYNNHVARSGRGIARRGSGGSGGRGGYASSDRAMSIGLQGVTVGMGIDSPGDPYAHTKKTRTKPIRNADGVLIRKDGRPDMRSQSSAANLRKVHARKEGDPNQSPSRFTPNNLHYSTSADVPDSSSPSGFAPDQRITPSVHEKHIAIMGKMFPSGVDQSRKLHDYTRQVFDEDRNHTVHSRLEQQHHNRPENKTSLQIKNEGDKQHRISEMQSPQEERAGIDRADDHADDEGQTPGEQSDVSGQEYHEAQMQEVLAQERWRNNGAQLVPKTQTVDSSARVGGEQTQTS
ncbi:hypothetical protein BKA66DRAFT_443712 [Pyrenochaeta sp. MPI-SDFR-AT-0127]|nr:hypothetical protein BKA66DRAFT_443712 [Pyrenochaeta sp. MPI-SDFR-AT-0127]